MNIRTNVPSKPPEFPAASLVLYGQAKVGKSTESARMPRPLFLNLEDGLSNVAADIIDLDNMAALLVALEEISRDLRAGKLAYRTVILDGLTSFVTKEALKVASKDPRKVAKVLSEGLLPALETFFDLATTRIITLHSRTTQFETRQNDKAVTVVTEEPDVSPRLRTFIVGKADAIGYCHTVNNSSVVDWLPTDTATLKIVAGNRLGLPRSTALSFAVINGLLTNPAKPAVAGNGSGKPAGALASTSIPAAAAAAGSTPSRPSAPPVAAAPAHSVQPPVSQSIADHLKPSPLAQAVLRVKPSALVPHLVALGKKDKRYLGQFGQVSFLVDAKARGFSEVTDANLEVVVEAVSKPPEQMPEDF